MLQEEMATHSSTRAWKIPWTEEPGRLQPMGSQKESDTTERRHFSNGENVLYPKEMKMLTGKYNMHINVHSSTVQNSRDVGTT